MDKNMLKRIASVATELDKSGFTKEAKSLDLILLKLAQVEMDDNGMDDIGMDDIGMDEYAKAYFEKNPHAPRGSYERKRQDTGMDDYAKAYFQKYPDAPRGSYDNGMDD